MCRITKIFLLFENFYLLHYISIGRLFELRGKTLFYYKEGKKSPCGMIYLTETTVEKDATRPRILKIQGRNLNRVIEIMAESDEVASEWVDILNQTIGKITPR